MSPRNLLFKVAVFWTASALSASSLAQAETSSVSYSKRKSGLYRDIFDQNIYNEETQYLHLERLSRSLRRRSQRSLDVNLFDEVPDSTFFVNRHARNQLSPEALKKGPSQTEGPDPSGNWEITKGKFDGITPGFFIKDAKGDKYLLKFDPVDSLEMATGAEVVASRFLHAIGYHVPQYTIVEFRKEQLTVGANARVYDESGFRKPLTPERLEEFLLFIPQTRQGSYRASASRILEGEILGPMKFQGRRKEDPEDLVNHEDRRSLRALRVFGSWLNNHDIRESNSLDVVQTKEGRSQIQHYLIDFNSSLGATPRGPKSPSFGHEHLWDYGETLKAILSLGLWKKPWQRRWDETGRETPFSGVGYFDNRHFDPGKWKTQLPHFAFKDLTRADAFWASKILLSFSDEEIREIVSVGRYSNAKTEEEITQVLIERRDQIGRYWFEKSNALDLFRLKESSVGTQLQFEDLAVRYGFVPQGVSTYRFKVRGGKGSKKHRLASEETKSQGIPINPSWFQESPSLELLIRIRRSEMGGWSPWVRVEIRQEAGEAQIIGIIHKD